MTREAAEALIEHIRRAVMEGSGGATLRLSDHELIFDRPLGASFRIDTPETFEGAHIYPAATTTPEGYPAGMPFIVGESVTVVQPHPAMIALLWWAPNMPRRIIDTIHLQSTKTGWEPVEDLAARDRAATRRTYRRFGAQREVLVAGRMVVLLQKDDNAEIYDT